MREILLAIFKTGSGSFLTLLLGMITTKIFAISLGPSGVGLFSLLRQTRDTFLSLTTFNGGTALVQGLASRKNAERQQYSLVVFAIILATTILAIILLWSLAPQIARQILHLEDPGAAWLIRWLSLPLFLGTGMMYLSGVLNGYRAIGRLALVHVLSTSVTVVIAYPTAHLVKTGHPAAFVWMMAISSAVGVLAAFEFSRREGWLPFSALLSRGFDKSGSLKLASSFLSFAFTTLITGLASTWAALQVRSLIVAQIGLTDAGIFDVAWTLSMMYITLVLSSFGTYYLPTLSQCEDARTSVPLIHRVLRLTLILVTPMITAVIVLKPLVIQLLYSQAFLPSLQVIRWMLLGDYLKSTSWVFGVTITASADKKTLLWSELLWQAGFIGLSALSLIRFKTLEGIGVAFALLYLFHLAFTFFYAYRRYKSFPPKDMLVKWGVGLALLIGSSIYTWTDYRVNCGAAMLWIGLALVFSWTVLRPEERKRVFQTVFRRYPGV